MARILGRVLWTQSSGDLMETNVVIQGDCLEVMRGMEDNSADLVVTDPPYGIGESGKKNRSRGTKTNPKDYGDYDWDHSPASDEQITEMIRVSKNQIIFGGNFFNLPPSPCWLVWDKDNGACDFADCELAWTSFKTAVRKFKWRWHGFLQENMKRKEFRSHPTQKPVPLMKWIIESYSKPGDLIIDPFAGSGSTGVGCRDLGRRYILIEQDPKYVKICNERLKQEVLAL